MELAVQQRLIDARKSICRDVFVRILRNYLFGFRYITDASIKERTVGNTFGLSIDCLDLVNNTTKSPMQCSILFKMFLFVQQSTNLRKKSLRSVIPLLNFGVILHIFTLFSTALHSGSHKKRSFYGQDDRGGGGGQPPRS